MDLFEVKDNYIIIRIDTNLIRKHIKQKGKDKIYGDMAEFIIEKAINGNITYIKKCIDIINKISREELK